MCLPVSLELNQRGTNVKSCMHRPTNKPWSQTEHVSGAGSERKMERSGPKIEWAGAERGAGVRKNDGAEAERGAGASWNGNGAVSGLNWPLKFRSKVICYWNFAMLYKLYLSHVKNKLSIRILAPIGLCCFWISNFDVFVWTASTLRQHTTETSVIITGTRFSDQILHDTFSPFRHQCVNGLYSQ